jgi:uncharacterized protein
VRFLEPSAFRPTVRDYRVLPFRFMRWADGEVLVTNEVGEFLFLPSDTFKAFAEHRLDAGNEAYRSLKARHFLADGNSGAAIELLATKVRTKRDFLRGFTRLHMFVVTLRCDHSCPYCQVSRVTQDRTRFDMSRETAARALDLMFQSPAPALKMEFQGGEPLLNFELIHWLILAAEERNLRERRDLQFVIATNLSPLTDEMLEFFRDHEVHLSTSLDGPRDLHNANRPRQGEPSYDITTRNIGRVRAALGHDRVSALMTTTERSLQCPRQVVDEYRRQAFAGIFLRSISPFGFAVRGSAQRQYDMEAFLTFYREALDHIIEVNRAGEPFTEIYAQILLRKMLTPFPTGYVDLQSPAGAGISAVAYNYDGDVYASDEARMLAEMGDTSFRLGNVHDDTYGAMFTGRKLRALVNASCHETLPGCTECAFAPFCGADPIWNWATQGDPVGHRPTSSFCTKNMSVIRHLLTLWRGGDAFIQKLFVRWATQ